MQLDSGIATILEGKNTSPPGSLPIMDYSNVRFESYYGEKTVGIKRYWTAYGHHDRADLLIEVLRNAKISTADRCMLSSFVDETVSGKYKIIQVQHLADEEGRLVTDLTLERIGDDA